LKTVSHGGADAGYRSHFIRFPDQRFSTAVLCNFPSSNPGRLARKVADVYLEEQFTEPSEKHEIIEVARAELEPLAGLYRHPASDTVWSVSMEEDHLTVGTERKRVLEPLGENRFRIEDSTTVITLEPIEPGKPVALHLPSSSGRDVVYERVERAQPSVRDLESYVGTYHSDELGADYAFFVQQDRLVLHNRKIGKVELEPSYSGGFIFQGYGMTFTRDGGGRVDGFTLSSGRVRRVRFERKP
jgi:hypothetical protein